MDTHIIIVSGLPRSGTSLMMQMLHSGGIEVVTDSLRTADTDNPRGYYEYEPVKKIKHDASWLPAMRGKALKMVSPLLYDLPASECYRVIFMERDLDETLRSQEKMLERLGRTGGPRDAMKQAYTTHLARLHEWLEHQAHISVLRVAYTAIVEQPLEQARGLGAFLDGQADVDGMARAVDPSLYRNRSSVSAGSGGERGG